MEDIKKSASRDHQQTTNEIKTVKSELNAVKDICNSVQETLAAMENEIASFETLVKNLNRNVTYSNVTKKNKWSLYKNIQKFNNRMIVEILIKSTSLPMLTQVL